MHCLWWVIFKAWGALRNSASFLLVSLFFLLSFSFFAERCRQVRGILSKGQASMSTKPTEHEHVKRHQNTVKSKKREVWGTSPLLWVLIQQTLLFQHCYCLLELCRLRASYISVCTSLVTKCIFMVDWEKGKRFSQFCSPDVFGQSSVNCFIELPCKAVTAAPFSLVLQPPLLRCLTPHNQGLSF